MSSVSSVSSVESVDTNLSISSISISDEDNPDIDMKVMKKRRASRVFRDRTSPFDLYGEDEFKKIFGLSKYAVQQIIIPIEKHFTALTLRNRPISLMNQLLIALRFFTSGTHQMTVADIFQVSQSSVCRIVRRISDAIITLADEYIKMPENIKEIRKVCSEFEEISGFPNVCGIIDCLHVRILSQPDTELYTNESGWASLNVQIICDANLRIRDIELLNPGSMHNNTIFNNSSIKNRFEKNEFGDTYLLGDNTYQTQKYLLTPIPNPKSPAELKYNEIHRKARNRIVKTFDILKKRFSCILSVLRITLDKITLIILAISILHNICLDLNETLDENINVYDEQPKTQSLEDDEALAAVRNRIVNKYFST